MPTNRTERGFATRTFVVQSTLLEVLALADVDWITNEAITVMQPIWIDDMEIFSPWCFGIR